MKGEGKQAKVAMSAIYSQTLFVHSMEKKKENKNFGYDIVFGRIDNTPQMYIYSLLFSPLGFMNIN